MEQYERNSENVNVSIMEQPLNSQYNNSDFSTFSQNYDINSTQAYKSSVYKFNAIWKVRVFTLIAIIALLTFLAIYNVFAMSALMGSIASTEMAILEKQNEISELKNNINSLNDESAIMNRVEQAGYSSEYPVASDTIIISNFENQAIYEGKTNWFDQLCDSISNFFGG